MTAENLRPVFIFILNKALGTRNVRNGITSLTVSKNIIYFFHYSVESRYYFADFSYLEWRKRIKTKSDKVNIFYINGRSSG